MSNSKKIALAVLSTALICAIAVAGTLAYLKNDTPDVTNTFTPAGGGVLVKDGAFVLEEHKVGSFPDEIAAGGSIGAYHYVNADDEIVEDLGEDKVPLAGPGAEVVNENTYQNVMPGMTLPKDPYIKITAGGKTEVPAYLYISVKDDEQSVLSLIDSLTDEQRELLLANQKYYDYQINADRWLPLNASQIGDTDMGSDMGMMAMSRGLSQAGGSSGSSGGAQLIAPDGGRVYVYAVGGKPARIAQRDGQLMYTTDTAAEASWTALDVDAYGSWIVPILKDNKVVIKPEAYCVVWQSGSSGGTSAQLQLKDFDASVHLTCKGYMAQAFNTDPAKVFQEVFGGQQGNTGGLLQ